MVTHNDKSPASGFAYPLSSIPINRSAAVKSIPEQARDHLEKMPPATEGSGGDWATFCAAAALVRGFALPEAEALPLLLAWNQTHCTPKWTLAELRQKLQSARNSTLPLGCLRKEPATGASRAAHLTNDSLSAVRRRQRWPAFQPLARTAIQRVAAHRDLPWPAVEMAARLGYLSGAMVDGHRCYLLHEGTFAQARRLDGQPFMKADGGRLKAKNLPGSEGAFIGLRTLGDANTRVLVVEGVIALLEALAAHELSDPADSWAILAATSAGSRFARAPDLLGRLKGRHVRILPDADDSGCGGAAAWLAELEQAGARVDLAPPLPPGCKDLGPVVSPSSSASHSDFFTSLFQ